jgi:hypothetical protein
LHRYAFRDCAFVLLFTPLDGVSVGFFLGVAVDFGVAEGAATDRNGVAATTLSVFVALLDAFVFDGVDDVTEDTFDGATAVLDSLPTIVIPFFDFFV